MKKIIGIFKKVRKKNQLKKGYAGKYAFVGVGHHSTNNLYPVLNYLKVPLKCIVTREKDTAEIVRQEWNINTTIDFESVLNDTEIKGIFICAAPESHYDLLSKSFLHQKNVFVEKPPCQTLDQINNLISLQEKASAACLVGLQKRYSPCTRILKSRLSKESVLSYNYRFITGAYPEGDALTDIFIHPLDLMIHLFGQAKIDHVGRSSESRNIFFITLKHEKAIGHIELSTEYSWSLSSEELNVNCKSGVYTMRNHELLSFTKKPRTLLSIPVEKVLPVPIMEKVLFHSNNSIPCFKNSQLFTAGYYSEIKSFVDLCESGKGKNLTSLKDTQKVYLLLNELKNQT